MNRLVTPVFTILLSGAAASALAGVNHLPEKVRASLEQPAKFRTFTSVSAIPESVRSAFVRAIGFKTFAMAEPGAKWQSSDLVVDGGLPSTRLESVAVSQEYLVLFYERGGLGHSYHVHVFRIKPDGAQLVWRAIRPSNVTSPNGLTEAIRSEVIEDDPKLQF